MFSLSLHCFKQFIDNLLHAIQSQSRQSIGKHRRSRCDFSSSDLMPHGQNDFCSVDFSRCESVQFLLWPVFREEVLAEWRCCTDRAKVKSPPLPQIDPKNGSYP